MTGTILTTLLVAGAVAAPATALQDGPPLRYALVVGSNAPMPGRDAALRFADDDAYKSAQVLGGTGVEVWLHTSFDEETAERAKARGAIGTPRPPTLLALRESLLEIRDRVAAARAAGRRTAFYFWYAGHGDIVDGEGAVALTGGVLRRSQLWREVIAVPAADTNHVIVDACRAYFFVFDRGRRAPRRPLGDLTVAPIPADLARRTGVVLSTAGGEESFEWEAVKSGIFGHEIRSGLSGGADVDRDRRISYLELAAFVDSANAALPDPAYRPTVTIRPPTHGDLLIDLAVHRGVELVLERSLRRHLFVEDALGMRWIDVHPDGSGELSLWLPQGARPGYLVSVADRREASLAGRGAQRIVRSRALRPRRSQRRGAAADAFTSLFGRPHGAEALTRFAATPEGAQVHTPYAAMVAALSPTPKAPIPPLRAAPSAALRSRISLVQREVRLTDRLPFATGGSSFIAEPLGDSPPRLVKLYRDDEGLSYERFAFLALDLDTRRTVRRDTEQVYFGDHARAWSLLGVGGVGAVVGSTAAVYAFVNQVPLNERLLFGLGGINLALLGAAVTLVGVGDHILIGIAESRHSKVAVDPALLEEGVRRYNDQTTNSTDDGSK